MCYSCHHTCILPFASLFCSEVQILPSLSIFCAPGIMKSVCGNPQRTPVNVTQIHSHSHSAQACRLQRQGGPTAQLPRPKSWQGDLFKTPGREGVPRHPPWRGTPRPEAGPAQGMSTAFSGASEAEIAGVATGVASRAATVWNWGWGGNNHSQGFPFLMFGPQPGQGITCPNKNINHSSYTVLR